MITKYVNDCAFTDALLADEYAAWSYGATKSLYEYYDQLSEEIGEDIQLDAVAIRCEWSEYESCLEYARDFSDFRDIMADEDEDNMSEDEIEDKAREFLEERTTVLEAKTPKVTDDGLRYVTSYVIMQS